MTYNRSGIRSLLACAAVLAAAGACAPAFAGTIMGEAFYRERAALPPSAVFEAELVDLSSADAAGDVLGRAWLEPAGSPPFEFEISYDDGAVKAGHKYVVRARVTNEKHSLFATDRDYPVLEGADAPLQLLLVSGRGGAADERVDSALSKFPASFEGIGSGEGGEKRWHLDLLAGGGYQLRISDKEDSNASRIDEIGTAVHRKGTRRLALHAVGAGPTLFAVEDDGKTLGKLEQSGKAENPAETLRLVRLDKASLIEPRLALSGMFKYMADAAMITLCADGRKFPVAMEGDYKALEAAYTSGRKEPAQELLVSIEGTIAMRPSAKGSLGPRPTLVVERFDNVWPRETCGNILVDSPLRGTQWKLVRLSGKPVADYGKEGDPHLILATNEKRVAGYGGCNRIGGSFESEGDKLRFGRMAGTRMACPDGMEEEQSFLDALAKVERYRIRGSHLDAYDGTGAAIARFEAGK